jgi:hypothetical protein
MSRVLSSAAVEGRPADVSPWLESEFVECYARWREESSGVRLSYERWRDAERDMEPLAYAAYLAALDREARAADEYRDCADRIAADSQ